MSTIKLPTQEEVEAAIAQLHAWHGASEWVSVKIDADDFGSGLGMTARVGHGAVRDRSFNCFPTLSEALQSLAPEPPEAIEARRLAKIAKLKAELAELEPSALEVPQTAQEASK